MLAPTLQIVVTFSAIFISAATFMLARKLVIRYANNRKAPHYLLWGIGMWLFGLSAFLEAEFALGIYSEALIDLYLFLVVVLVQLISFGSIELTGSRYKRLYYAFSIILALLTLLSITVTYQGNLIENYVVAAPINAYVVITSSIATASAYLVIAATALQSYLKSRRTRTLSIVAGIAVVASSAALHTAAVPELLYYAEFIGMVLLWVGFT